MIETTDKVQPLLDHLGTAAFRDWRILELGPYNGRNTVQLAPHCREIVCVEPRLANVAACAANCAESGYGGRCRVMQGDLDLCRRLGSFDLLFHSGVLYHLDDPIEHLRQLPALARRMLLNTHYAETGRDVLGDGIRGEWKPENVNNPRAGLQGLSFWLCRDALIEQLERSWHLTVIKEHREGNGPRIAVYCERICCGGQYAAC